MATSRNSLAGRHFQDQTGAPIVPGRRLGAGGEGVVHQVDGTPGSVVKIWHPGKTPQDAVAKVRHMVNNPVAPEPGADWHIAWPQRMVIENRVIVGYTMPILNPDEQWEPIVDYYNRLQARNTSAAQGRELRIDDRLRMARNLALGFRAVHQAGYVIGDVNEKNIEVNRQNDIAMVDCDSYGFTDTASGKTFSNEMGRPEFQAPELYGRGNYANRTQNHDLFGLAVVIFHLLTGYHPHTITNLRNYNQADQRVAAWLFPPASGGRLTAPDQYNKAWAALPDKQKQLFLRCFDKNRAGSPRPTPEEWVEALREAPTREQLRQEEERRRQDTSARQQEEQRRREVEKKRQEEERRRLDEQRRQQEQERRLLDEQRQRQEEENRRLEEERRQQRRQEEARRQQQRQRREEQQRQEEARRQQQQRRQEEQQRQEGIRRQQQRQRQEELQRQEEARRQQQQQQSRLTKKRWLVIGISLLFSAWLLRELIGTATQTWLLQEYMGTAMQVWPWWLWLGVGLATAYVILVPFRKLFHDSSAGQFWMFTGTSLLIGILIYGNLNAAYSRDFPDGYNFQQLLGMAAGNGGADPDVPSPNLANPVSSGSMPVVIPVPPPSATPTVTPTSEPTATLAPTAAPTSAPTVTSTPTETPTFVPMVTFAPIPTLPAIFSVPTLPPIAPIPTIPTIIPVPPPVLNTPIPPPKLAYAPIPTSAASPTPTPTAMPTATPTPAPTRVPLLLRHAQRGVSHHTINEPSGWSGGRVTFFAQSYSGPPAQWVQANTIMSARRYEIKSLKDAGVNLVGTYFKERYTSEELCGTKGYIAIRETALLVAYPEVGVALHVDVCEADLSLEAEPGITNEVVSEKIIRSLRKQN